MKIYIAASFVDQRELRAVADKLWSLGQEVTASWLQEVTKPDSMSTEEFNRKLAIKDVAEVYAADVVILDNRRSSGGKNTEWGIGIGQHQKKQLWLVGQPSTVFHYLADRMFNSWEEVYQVLMNATPKAA